MLAFTAYGGFGFGVGSITLPTHQKEGSEILGVFGGRQTGQVISMIGFIGINKRLVVKKNAQCLILEYLLIFLGRSLWSFWLIRICFWKYCLDNKLLAAF